MAATTGGEAGGLGGVTGDLGQMEIDGDGIGTASGVEASKNRAPGATGQPGGTVAQGACERAGGTTPDRAAELSADAMAAAAAGCIGAEAAELEGEEGAGDAVEEAAGLRAQQLQEEQPQPPQLGEKISGARLKLTKEFWCLRAVTAYPKAAEAAAAVREYVMEAWGGFSQLKGFPVEVLVYDKVKNREATPAPTGLVKVTRAADDGWQADGWIRLCQNAWPLEASIDRCCWVKTFGASNDHGREINWLMCTLHRFLAAGNALSIDPKSVVFGYAELPPRVARMNGAEWTGFAYGANLPLHDLMAVVEWGGLADKDSKAGLKPELKIDGGKRGVVSTFIPAGQPGHRFHPADFIAGSFTLLIESKLKMLDFDLEASDSPAGVELLCEIFGEEVVLDVVPSVGGLVGTGIVRVKVKCGLRHEKEARAHAQALAQDSEELEQPRVYAVGGRELEIHFHSEESARAMADLVESSSSGGKGNAGNARALLELQTVTSALAEVKQFQLQSVSRLASLAEEQRNALSSCASKIEDLAKLQAVATVESQEKFEATQRQLADLASGQALAAQDCREQLAEVQKQAFAFAQTLHLQLTESIGAFAVQLRQEKPSLTQKGLHVAVENVPPVRLVAEGEPGVGAAYGEGHLLSGWGSFLVSSSARSGRLGAHSRAPSGSQYTGGTFGAKVRWGAPASRRYDCLSSEAQLSEGRWALVGSSVFSLVGQGRSGVYGWGLRQVRDSVSILRAGREERQKVLLRDRRLVTGSGVFRGQAARLRLVLLLIGVCLSAGVNRNVLGDGESWQRGWYGKAAISQGERSGRGRQQLGRGEQGGGWGSCSFSAQEGRGLQGAKAGAAGWWQESERVHIAVVQAVSSFKERGVEAARGHIHRWWGRGAVQGSSVSVGAACCGKSALLGWLVEDAGQVCGRGLFRRALQVAASWYLDTSSPGGSEGWKEGKSGAICGRVSNGRGSSEDSGFSFPRRGGKTSITQGWDVARRYQTQRGLTRTGVAPGGRGEGTRGPVMGAEPVSFQGGCGYKFCEGAAAEQGGWNGRTGVRRGRSHLSFQASCDYEEPTVGDPDRRGPARLSGLHTHSKQVLCDRSRSGDGRGRGCGGGGTFCAGMGYAVGAAARRGEGSRRAGGCARGAGQGHRRAGGSLRRGTRPPSARLVHADGDVAGRCCAGWPKLHLSLLGHRHWGCGDGVSVSGEVEVSAGGGGGAGGTNSPAGSVAREVRGLRRGCPRSGCQAETVAAKGGGGFLFLELEMRAVVAGKHGAFSQDGEKGILAACGRGDSGADEGCSAGGTEGGGHRMRCRTSCCSLSEVLELAVRVPSAAASLDVVVASDRSGMAVSWQLAEKEAVDCGSTAAWPVKLWDGWFCEYGSVMAWLVLKGRGCRRRSLKGRRSEARGGSRLSSRALLNGPLATGYARWIGAHEGLRLRHTSGGETSPAPDQEGGGLLGRVHGEASSSSDAAGFGWGRDASGEGAAGQNGLPTVAGGCSSVADRGVEQEAGACLFWNTRQLCMPTAKDGSSGSGSASSRMAAAGKLRLLMEAIDAHTPWLVALLEVDSSRGRMRALRSWFRRRGYEMVHLPGEGSSRGGGSRTNGVVLAASREVQLLESRRVAFRALAVEAVHKKTGCPLRVVIMHGASVDCCADAEEEERAFGCQLEAAVAWCSAHEGALLADVNRVPCVNWRLPASRRLNKGDVLFRKLTGWSCTCCAESADPAECEMQLIGHQLDDRGTPCWTRWSAEAGLAPSKSRLDVGLACGLSRGIWLEASVVRKDLGLSDHAVVRYDLRVSAPAGPHGEARPLPIRLGERPRADMPRNDGCSAWEVMHTLTGEEAFLSDLRGGLSLARLAHSSAVEAMVPLFCERGQTAVQRAYVARSNSRRGHEPGGRPGCFDNKSDRKVWEQRIKLAQSIARGERSLTVADWLLLFHPRSGMRRFCPRFFSSAGASVDWAGYVRRCRRQWERALWYVERANRDKDRRLAEVCHRLEAAGGSIDSSTHINSLWRMIRDGGSSDKLRKLHVGDSRAGRVLTTADEDFLPEAGRIGELFVKSMDRGCCPEALRAWLEVFVTRRFDAACEEAPWDVAKAFSYQDFLRTIQAMRGKAVGAGGLSVELLLASTKEARWLFYQALLQDAQSGCFAKAWKRVLYVLLRKPAPNDPEIIAQRREIALMPQDLKILLQGIRRDTFSKIGDSLGAEQFGWKAGYGCADPGLALAAVLQQARRLQHPVFVLYIDLANFFPAINRKAASMCEGWAGLPVRVAEVMEAVYGAADEPDKAVRCQYDTAAGLGNEFRNHVGRLMGCPISPDSAKILLESIISAIRQSVTGVALWPFEGEEVVQVAYADDWTGIFDDVGQLRKAWSLWMIWAELIGARLGIKGFFKTVVSGSVWEGGRCKPVPDPMLRDNEKRKVPLADPDRLYKHLGVPRACCAEGSLAWKGGDGVPGIRDKLRACIGRLRRLRRHSTSIDQFMTISNVLLGGMAGVYMQSAPVSFEETEEIERAWRRTFCRFAKRDFNAPAAELYRPGESWRLGRTHIYGVGSAALFSAVEKAMADPRPSPAREAVRSAVALALFSWGCRSEPNCWSWSHLRSELRRGLRGKGLRGIGEAWMLASEEMERFRDSSGSVQARDEELRVRAWGRWRGMAADGAGFNPLGQGVAAFQTHSLLLFEPRERGGLGLPIKVELLNLGVATISDLAATPFRGAGEEGRWLVEKRAVKARLGVARLTPAVWKAWVETVEAARADEVRPVVGQTVGCRHMRYVSYRRRVGDLDCQARILNALVSAKGETACCTPAEVWAARLRKGFAPRALGAQDRGATAACGTAKTALGWRIEKDGSEDFIDRGELAPNVFPAAWRDDWRPRMLAMREMVKFDSVDGWPCRPRAAGWDSDEGFMDALPPALQLAVRARGMVGREAKVLQAGRGCKVPGWRVALDAQVHMWETLCELQARLEFQFAFAVDASSGARIDERGLPVRDEWGWACKSTSAVAVCHTGVTLGGILDPHLPSDNYVGELVALVVALRSVPPCSNVLLVFDATSPLRAWRRFRQRCVRGKWKYQEAPYLEELERLLRRQRLVYFCWQSSHCGEPVNEVADCEAERVRGEDAAEWLTEQEESPLFSMWPARPRGSLFAWARSAMGACVKERLGQCGLHVLQPEEDDWELGSWDEYQGALLSAMRRCTLMAGDDGHRDDRHGERDVARRSCPLGCATGCSSWVHFAFQCEHAELREKRAWWREWLIRNRCRFDGLGTHKQVEAVLALMRGCDPWQRATGYDPPVVRAQRLMAGLVEKVALPERGKPVFAKEAVRELVCGGLDLLGRAVELEAELRRSILVRILDNKKARAALRYWGKRCSRLGPGRHAGLWQLRIWRTIVEKAVALKVAAGDMDGVTAWEWILRARHLASAAQAALRCGAGKLEGEVHVQWFCMGRLMHAVLRRGGRSWPLQAWGPEVAELREVAVQLWPPAASLELLKFKQVRFIRGRNGQGEAIRIGFCLPGLRDLRAGAFRRWFRAGGAPLLGRLARARASAAAAERKARRLKERQVAQVGLRRFCVGLACSGGEIPKVPVEERIIVELGAAKRKTRAEDVWQRGLKADKRGRWAVSDITDVRCCEPVEAGWEALVVWMGPFPACWVHSSNLCGPALVSAKEMAVERLGLRFRCRRGAGRPRTMPSIRKAPSSGRRRSPRLVAMESGELGTAVATRLGEERGEAVACVPSTLCTL